MCIYVGMNMMYETLILLILFLLDLCSNWYSFVHWSCLFLERNAVINFYLAKIRLCLALKTTICSTDSGLSWTSMMSIWGCPIFEFFFAVGNNKFVVINWGLFTFYQVFEIVIIWFSPKFHHKAFVAGARVAFVSTQNRDFRLFFILFFVILCFV